MKPAKTLRSASDALYYELLMLDVTAKVLSSEATRGSSLGGAILESFLVHLRNMIDFLYLPKCNKDDILAEDFFADPEDWMKLHPKQGMILKAAKKRINKLLAHLTYSRLKLIDADSDWIVIGLRNEIVSRIIVFVDNVSRDMIDEKLRRLIADCLSQSEGPASVVSAKR